MMIEKSFLVLIYPKHVPQEKVNSAHSLLSPCELLQKLSQAHLSTAAPACGFVMRTTEKIP
jgi:hypothetical protein